MAIISYTRYWSVFNLNVDATFVYLMQPKKLLITSRNVWVNFPWTKWVSFGSAVATSNVYEVSLNWVTVLFVCDPVRRCALFGIGCFCVCVCVCVFVCMCSLYMNISIHMRAISVNVSVCVCVCVCVSACKFVCKCPCYAYCLLAHTHTHTHVITVVVHTRIVSSYTSFMLLILHCIHRHARHLYIAARTWADSVWSCYRIVGAVRTTEQ